MNQINELIDDLNSSHVEDEIEDRLRERLAVEGLNINARIHFYEGSIEWDGVLYVMNWMAVTGGTIGLVDYLRKIIMSVINTTIKQRLPRSLRRQAINTTVYVEEEIIPPVSLPTLQQQNSLPLSNQAPAVPAQQIPYNYVPNDDGGMKKFILTITLINSCLIGALVFIAILILTSTRF